MSARLTEQELAEIMEYVGYWKYDSETRHGPRSFSRSGGVIRLQKLLAELDAVRAERDEARAALADKAMLLERYAALLQQNVGLGKDRDAIRAERDEARDLLRRVVDGVDGAEGDMYAALRRWDAEKKAGDS